jgi:hypothetical protein
MKKGYLALAAVAALALPGCGGTAVSDETTSAVASYDTAESWDGGFSDYEVEESAGTSDLAASDVSASAQVSSDGSSEQYEQKLVRTYTYNFETLEFDASMAYVEQKVAEYGGYIEASESSGSRNRYATLTIRIPQEKRDAFLNETGEIGEIIYQSSSSENISTSYYDTKSRLASLNTQHERLLELLAEAQSLDDVFALNSQLADVEYDIDRYTTMLRVYDNKVDYVTINFTIREVQQIQAAEDDTFWTQIQKGFTSNTADVINGLMSVVLFLVTGIPYFLVLGVLVLVIVLIVRRIRKAVAARKHRTEEK